MGSEEKQAKQNPSREAAPGESLGAEAAEFTDAAADLPEEERTLFLRSRWEALLSAAAAAVTEDTE